jgi:hypothetical protein
MAGRSKHKWLLQDPEVSRWFNNLARGSIITAEERLRRLGRLCEALGQTPKSLIEFESDPDDSTVSSWITLIKRLRGRSLPKLGII